MTALLAGSDESDNALLLNAAMDNIPFGFNIWSPDLRLLMWNQQYLDIYGFASSQIHAGMTLDEVVQLGARNGNHLGQSPEAFISAYRAELLTNRSGLRVRSRERLFRGRTVEIAHIYRENLGWIVTHEDITEELASSELVQRRKHELERQNYRLDAAVNNISQGLCMFDGQGRLVICNAPYARIYRLSEDQIRPGTPLDVILGHLFDHGFHASSATTREEYIAWRHEVIARGEHDKAVVEFGSRVIMMQHHPMKDGGFVSTHEDITEQRHQEARIRHMARHDPLTGLANRTNFLEEMAVAEAHVARGERVAVLCVDLDSFKWINDSYGHAIGDRLLKEAAARLWNTTRETDLVARTGGDEFCLLVRPAGGPGEVAAMAERIIGTMGMPFMVEGHQLTIGACVGVAMAPEDGQTTDVLMKNADLALYRAKAEGPGSFNFFEKDMDAAVQRRRVLEVALRGALERGELRMMYQPLLGLRDETVTCFEALMRWSHEGRSIAPSEFIPIAEETGLIVAMGEFALRQACSAAARWPSPARVAVNLSPVQFRNRHLFDCVRDILEETGLLPTRLELEITESLLLRDSEETLQTLHRLRDLGIRISMDDFGTGYSSLSYLRSFPFDKIKIDRTFMRDLDRGADSLAIIRAVIQLGQSLGMSTTAEGIETEAQLQTVRELGCTEAQGYFISEPVEVADVAPLLLRERGKPRLRAVS